jgi:predicted acylesterase/phospholipase RssA
VGITIVQKSDLSKPQADAKTALVLAGGAVTGGAFKLGGLAALDRYLENRKVTQFDIYMGISAGALIAAPIAAGIEPQEMVESFIGEPRKVSRFGVLDFYNPNWQEIWERPVGALRDLAALGPKATLKLLKLLPPAVPGLLKHAREFLAEPSITTAERIAEPILAALAESPPPRLSWLPSGLFDNAPIERYVRENLERNNVPNQFRQLKLQTGKSLYIGATNLNTAQGVVFGHDEDHTVTISEAVQASTAIPGFFKPPRLGPPGREQHYVDGAVRKTANVSVAVRHGAQLIICYNPFRPFVNYRNRIAGHDRSSIADLGLAAVVNQAFRTMLHSRLRLGIEKLKLDDTFRGDLILIEPTETDERFFAMNPVAFWHREAAAEHGFQSVRQSLSRHHESLRTILGAYGIDVNLRAIGEHLRVPEGAQPIPMPAPETRRRPRLRIVAGGR